MIEQDAVLSDKDDFLNVFHVITSPYIFCYRFAMPVRFWWWFTVWPNLWIQNSVQWPRNCAVYRQFIFHVQCLKTTLNQFSIASRFKATRFHQTSEVVFLSQYYLRNRKHPPCFYRVIDRNTSGILREREMLWGEASVSIAFSSSPTAPHHDNFKPINARVFLIRAVF